LSGRGAVEVCQPVAAQLRCVVRRAPVDLNRPTDRPQIQVVADANSTSLGKRFWQGDLELARHFRHEPIIAFDQGQRQGFRLDSVFWTASRP
jgi:hypothetical protein